MKGKIKRRDFIKHAVYGSLLYPLLPYWSDLAEAQTLTNLGRLILVYYPNGFGTKGFLASGSEDNFTLGPAFSALNPHKNDLIALSNLKIAIGDQVKDESMSENHKIGGSLLFSAHSLSGKDTNKNYSMGASIDQVLAKWHFDNGHSRVKSLNLKLDRGASVHHTGPKQPVVYDMDPVAAFNKIFKYFTDEAEGGGSNTPSLAQRLWSKNKSILDVPSRELNSIKTYLPKDGVDLLNTHLESIRELELKIQNETNPIIIDNSLGKMEKPNYRDPLKPANNDANIDTFIELIDVAFRHNITRVATLSFGGRGSRLNIPDLNLVSDHHTYSHEGEFNRNNNSDAADGSIKFVDYYSRKVAKLVDTLKGNSSIGTKNLMNETAIMYSSEAGTTHNWHGDDNRKESIPVILLGNPNGYYKTGKYHDIRGNLKAHQGILMSLAHSTGATHINSVGEQKYSQYNSGPLGILKA